ncbi:CcoQ/FixQ family Cbb3-type cytochrome c oxidase assembly chaperone [Tabrizicola sp. TH137]|uniref:cbb3-type cytochrome c oxidase subunit 3 n=1 Tax=Tabrizicola sp. TH137 TaxID=2067452 RepID=UPI000C7A9551|nr:cbb3-type cytochrome c oxidase subunit 3 [Tabrizicola sp. TH137]PLL14287.1 CcoQ/FixQ family Cbb3-type cytochrome c oxidase assembly chaperone [Tabrizicola sp. TH137]
METYSLLREFADSWMLLLLVLVFLGVVFWAWRPGSRKLHDEAATSIFRNELKPAGGGAPAPARSEREA